MPNNQNIFLLLLMLLVCSWCSLGVLKTRRESIRLDYRRWQRQRRWSTCNTYYINSLQILSSNFFWLFNFDNTFPCPKVKFFFYTSFLKCTLKKLQFSILEKMSKIGADVLRVHLLLLGAMLEAICQSFTHGRVNVLTIHICLSDNLVFYK